MRFPLGVLWLVDLQTAWPFKSVAAPVTGRLVPSAPPLPPQMTCAEGNPMQTNIHSHRHWKGFIEVVKTGRHTALMLANTLAPNPLTKSHTYFSCSAYMTHKNASGSYGLSGVWTYPIPWPAWHRGKPCSEMISKSNHKMEPPFIRGRDAKVI